MEATVAVIPRLAECCILFGLGYKLRESGVLTGADGQVCYASGIFKVCVAWLALRHQMQSCNMHMYTNQHLSLLAQQTALSLATYVTLPCVIIRALST